MKHALAALVALLALTLVVAAGVGIAELIVRDSAAQRLYGQARLRLHPFLQVVPIEGLVDGINRARFRGEEIERVKPAGALRIFAIGGSTTLGIANRYRETYPYYLQELLRTRYPNRRIEVQNAGVDWYATPHILINYALRVRQYDPDVVIVYEAINDIYRSFSPPWLSNGPYSPDYSHYLGPYARFLGPQVEFADAPSQSWLGSLLLWRLIRQRFTGEPNPFRRDAQTTAALTARLRPIEISSFRSLDSFRANYELIVRTILGDGHRLVVGSQPSFYKPDMTRDERQITYYGPVFCAENGQYPTLDSLRRGMVAYNAAARDVAARFNVPFVDLDAAVPKTLDHFSDDVHLRPAGNEIVARTVFDWMVKERVLE